MEVRRHVLPIIPVVIAGFIISSVATFYVVSAATTGYKETLSDADAALTTGVLRIAPQKNGLAEVRLETSPASAPASLNTGQKLGDRLKSTSLNLLPARSVSNQPYQP